MSRRASIASRNAFVGFLMQLSPAARLGLIVFLLALAMVVAGLGVRSVTYHRSPIHSNEPPLMVYEEAASHPALPIRYSSGT